MTETSNLKNQIIQILEKETFGLKITDLAAALNVSSNDKAVRKSLQRALKALELQNKIVPRVMLAQGFI